MLVTFDNVNLHGMICIMKYCPNDFNQFLKVQRCLVSSHLRSPATSSFAFDDRTVTCQQGINCFRGPSQHALCSYVHGYSSIFLYIFLPIFYRGPDIKERPPPPHPPNPAHVVSSLSILAAHPPTQSTCLCLIAHHHHHHHHRSQCYFFCWHYPPPTPPINPWCARGHCKYYPFLRLQAVTYADKDYDQPYASRRLCRTKLTFSTSQ